MKLQNREVEDGTKLRKMTKEHLYAFEFKLAILLSFVDIRHDDDMIGAPLLIPIIHYYFFISDIMRVGLFVCSFVGVFSLFFFIFYLAAVTIVSSFKCITCERKINERNTMREREREREKSTRNSYRYIVSMVFYACFLQSHDR